VRLALTAVARPGDLIAVESPTFFGTLQALSHLGMRALEIPGDPAAGIDLSLLQHALRRHRLAGVITVPAFNNPSGSRLEQAQREALVKMTERAGVPVIEIDLYGDLHHQGQRPWAAKRHDESGHVLLCGSFSKTVAPGFRIGWIAPGRYYDQVVAAQLSSTYATPSLLPAAMALFLKEGGYDRYLRIVQRLYSERVPALRAELLAHLPESCEITSPHGGYLLWVKLPNSCNSWNIYREARRRGLSAAPGELFSTTGRYRHHLRIHGGHALTRPFQNAIRTLAAIINSTPPRETK
jgi:DNA-binding transcriptional MocR family regulator